MKAIVLGVGNLMLEDDSVCLHIARDLKGRLNQGEMAVTETGAAGVDFLKLLGGYDRAIVIDAIQTGRGRVGQVYRLGLEDFDIRQYANTFHGLNFVTALKLDKRVGLRAPRQTVIFATEVRNADSLIKECTVEVKRAIPAFISMILKGVELPY